MKKFLVAVGATLTLASTFATAELIQQFKDPTFSGNGWTTQVLTLEQMRQSTKASVESKAAADLAAAAAAAANTPLAKFMALFTGQVYSQLATQLSNNLFQSCADPVKCASGNFNISDSQQIQWTKSGGNVTLNVYTTTMVNGVQTVVAGSTPLQSITVPISSFAF